jgi:hypothetical protein
MRLVAIVLACAFSFAVPAQAQYNQAPREPRECTRLTKQINRYNGDVKRAQKRGNELWEASMQAHVLKLEQRRVARCPQYAVDASDLIFWNNLLTTAAEAAYRYFTWDM